MVSYKIRSTNGNSANSTSAATLDPLQPERPPHRRQLRQRFRQLRKDRSTASTLKFTHKRCNARSKTKFPATPATIPATSPATTQHPVRRTPVHVSVCHVLPFAATHGLPSGVASSASLELPAKTATIPARISAIPPPFTSSSIRHPGRLTPVRRGGLCGAEHP